MLDVSFLFSVLLFQSNYIAAFLKNCSISEHIEIIQNEAIDLTRLRPGVITTLCDGDALCGRAANEVARKVLRAHFVRTNSFCLNNT